MHADSGQYGCRSRTGQDRKEATRRLQADSGQNARIKGWMQNRTYAIAIAMTWRFVRLNSVMAKLLQLIMNVGNERCRTA